eukprot:Skav211595  [mRNA]  locus=scaffold2962:72628:72894:+ [translate_table: standard]
MEEIAKSAALEAYSSSKASSINAGGALSVRDVEAARSKNSKAFRAASLTTESASFSSCCTSSLKDAPRVPIRAKASQAATWTAGVSPW